MRIRATIGTAPERLLQNPDGLKPVGMNPPSGIGLVLPLCVVAKQLNEPRSNAVAAALAGGVGGLAGTLAMNYAQRAWTLVSDGHSPRSAAGPHDARDWQERTEDQNANELFAQTLASTTVKRRLSDRELSVVASIIHFGFGVAVGAAYGAYVGTASRHRRSGAAFGTALWLAADEIAMPLLGLSGSTLERPLEMHGQSLVAHLVYGVVAERVRRVTRRALDWQRHKSAR